MSGELIDPRLAQLTPQQRAEFYRVDKEAKDVVKKMTQLFNTNRYSPEGALAGLSSVAGAIIGQLPDNIKRQVFTGFQQGVRETAFTETIIASGAAGLFVPPPAKPPTR